MVPAEALNEEDPSQHQICLTPLNKLRAGCQVLSRGASPAGSASTPSSTPSSARFAALANESSLVTAISPIDPVPSSVLPERKR